MFFMHNYMSFGEIHLKIRTITFMESLKSHQMIHQYCSSLSIYEKISRDINLQWKSCWTGPSIVLQVELHWNLVKKIFNLQKRRSRENHPDFGITYNHIGLCDQKCQRWDESLRCCYMLTLTNLWRFFSKRSSIYCTCFSYISCHLWDFRKLFSSLWLLLRSIANSSIGFHCDLCQSKTIHRNSWINRSIFRLLFSK